MQEEKEKKQILKKQTYYISEENIEALFLWNVETREGISRLINRLIEENCPKEVMEKARENIKERGKSNEN